MTEVSHYLVDTGVFILYLRRDHRAIGRQGPQPIVEGWQRLGENWDAATLAIGRGESRADEGQEDYDD